MRARSDRLRASTEGTLIKVSAIISEIAKNSTLHHKEVRFVPSARYGPIGLIHYTADLYTTELTRKRRMRIAIAKLYLLGQIILQENGQDLVEYALVVAMVSMLAIMVLADGVNGAMITLSSRLNVAIA